MAVPRSFCELDEGLHVGDRAIRRKTGQRSVLRKKNGRHLRAPPENYMVNLTRTSEVCPSLSACPSVSPPVLAAAAAAAVDAEAAAAGARPAAGAAVDVPAPGAAARAAAPGYAFVPSLGAAAGVAAASAVCADRRLFADPRAGVLGPVAVRHVDALDPVVAACSPVLVDAAARAGDCRLAADSTAELTEADHCCSAGHC